MDDDLSVCSQTIFWPPTSTGICNMSSTYDSFASSCEQTNPCEHTLLSGATTFSGSHHAELPSSYRIIPRYESRPVKNQSEHIAVLEGTPDAPFGGPTSMGTSDYNDISGMTMASPFWKFPVGFPEPQSMHSISPQAIMKPAGSITTSAQSVSSAELTELFSPRSCTEDSPTSLFTVRDSISDDADTIGLDQHPQTSANESQPQESPFVGQSRPRRKALLYETQRKNAELQRTKIGIVTRASGQTNSSPARALHKCDYLGCNKVFVRGEHLKRHKHV
ncbi:hypothetical protein Purlil1_13602 [Purpureocillium lilacinum]|uniref:C2H2-type domain-containing protein n=1 Tax=Purpureocillium lilacinum TaxID=33203 RepID=A0ABR0BDL6_PURLI|nr:hypothetical protein Purlil1_13602 [Purpureocillium lilacinum]